MWIILIVQYTENCMVHVLSIVPQPFQNLSLVALCRNIKFNLIWLLKTVCTFLLNPLKFHGHLTFMLMWAAPWNSCLLIW